MIGNKLNKAVKKFFVDLEKDLNKNSIPFGEQQPGGFYFAPTIVGLGNSTDSTGNSGVIALHTPEAGMITDSLLTQDDRRFVVVRRILGYAASARLAANPTKENIRKTLLPLVTEMILTLKRDLRFGPENLNMGIYGTFKRPGDGFEYFRDMENNAGYELRLYSDAQNLIKLENT